ncbi:MAG: acyltransferase family protein [Steroidobacteraceae bacterium]
MHYRKEVDGLRAIAIVPVLFFHAGFATFRGGYVGVDIFFVISGYLITSLILAEQATGSFTIAGFYERRARRILPALFVVMLACIVPGWIWLTPARLQDFGQSLIAVTGFANNILLGFTSGYFAAATDEKPLLHTWSLAVEEQYYLVFPVAIAICWPLGRRRLIMLIAVGAVASLCLAEWGWRHQPQLNFYMPQARAWELFVGAIIAFKLESASATPVSSLSVRNALAMIGLLLIAYSIFFFDDQIPFPSLYALAPTLGTALVLYTADEHTLVGRWLRIGPMVGMGLISYSLYLWHQPLLAYARIISNTTPGKPLLFGLILTAICLAYLSWRYVEKPFRNRAFLSRSTIFGYALTGSLIIAGIGLTLHLGHGFVKRMPEAYVAELAHFEQLKTDHEKLLEHSCYLSAAILNRAPVMQQQWNCQPLASRARILVVGDSHAWDKALALRLNGIAADQLAGPDCSLAPSRMQYNCRKKFDAAFKARIFENYEVVLLANRWNDLKEVHDFEQQLEYWRRTGSRLMMFGPMPEFGKFADHMSYLVGQGLSRPEAAQAARYDQQKFEEIDTALRDLARRKNIEFLDTANMFCHLSKAMGCVPISNQDYLIFDYAHLSAVGAKLLGAKIAEELRAKGISGPL